MRASSLTWLVGASLWTVLVYFPASAAGQPGGPTVDPQIEAGAVTRAGWLTAPFVQGGWVGCCASSDGFDSAGFLAGGGVLVRRPGWTHAALCLDAAVLGNVGGDLGVRPQLYGSASAVYQTQPAQRSPAPFVGAGVGVFDGGAALHVMAGVEFPRGQRSGLVVQGRVILGGELMAIAGWRF